MCIFHLYERSGHRRFRHFHHYQLSRTVLQENRVMLGWMGGGRGDGGGEGLGRVGSDK